MAFLVAPFIPHLSAFCSPSTATVRVCRNASSPTPFPVRRSIVVQQESSPSDDGGGQSSKLERPFKFDPNSETDAFGRDPRKETEFWRGTAKDILASDEMKEALASRDDDPNAGLTDEQKAYMEFIKSLDEKKEHADS